MKRIIISTVLAAAFAACTHADVTTVAANETVTVTDANVADYADGFAFADATGVIEFETSTAPTMNITGAGTVKKTYNGDWTMTKAISSFTGTYDLCGSGVVSFNASYVFGDNNSANKVYVRNGATLRFVNENAKLWSRTLHVAGFGASGAKAALMCAAYDTGGGTIRNLVLDADASIYMESSNVNHFFTSGTFNMNGHKLYHSGPGVLSTTGGQKLKNGEIVTINDGTGTPIYCFRKASVDKDSPVRFVHNGTTKFQMTDMTIPAPTAEMWIAGAFTFQVSDSWDSSWWDWTTNSIGWAGPIVFTNETGMSSLTLVMSGASTPQRQINFLGPISGNGRLVLSPELNKTRVCLGNANNTFTGGLYWNGNKKNVRLLPLHPGSIPDYSSVTCNYGHIDCVFDSADTEAPWDFAHFRELANSATWLNSSFAAIVGAGGDGEVPPITFDSSITNPIGANAAVTITGSDESSFSNLTWLCGTARILGPGKFNVGALKIPNGTKQIGTNTYSAVVELDNGVEFVTASNATRVGYYDASDTSQVARLVVKNAFIHGPDDQPQKFAQGNHYALAVGCNGSKYGGILEVCDGAVVSNKLLVSGWGSGAGGGDGRGMIIQRGGKVYCLGATADTHFGPGVGMGGTGHGTYIMHGGEFTAFASFHIGGYCMGNWTQFGGTAVFTNYPGNTEKTFTASSLNRGWGEIYLAGGTMDVRATFSLASGSISDSQHCRLVIDGPDAFFDTHSSRLRASANSGKHLAQVTVRNGGKLRTSGMRKTYTSSVYTITFDGGTYLCGAGGQDLFCYPDENKAMNYAQALDLVAVFPGGITIDTGASTNNYTAVPIKGATGGGISKVPFSEPISGADGFVQPYVDIAGDGLGATAVALFDTELYAVTGIVVTCPGVEYTTATAMVYVAKNLKKTIVLDDYIVPNENTGGFTKTGDHDFTLKATNTWGGATTVAGGTLIAGVDWAIPPNTDVILENGGILDFNSKTGEVATVTYGAGGGSIVNASKVKIDDDSIFFKISVDDLLAGKTIPWTGNLDYSRANLTVTGDLSRLVAGTRYHVVTVTDGEATGTLTLASDDPPSGWEYRVTSKGVKIAEVKGSAIVIR